jgi:hypothetical protein
MKQATNFQWDPLRKVSLSFSKRILTFHLRHNFLIILKQLPVNISSTCSTVKLIKRVRTEVRSWIQHYFTEYGDNAVMTDSYQRGRWFDSPPNYWLSSLTRHPWVSRVSVPWNRPQTLLKFSILFLSHHQSLFLSYATLYTCAHDTSEAEVSKTGSAISKQ